MGDALRIDRVRHPGTHRPLHRDPGGLQRRDGCIHRLHRNHLVSIAMDQEDRRPAARLPGQPVGAEQRSRVAQHSGNRALPAQRDVQCGHGALGEPDQRQLVIAQPIRFELGVEEGVNNRRDRLDAEQQGFRSPVAQREPLVAERRHVARLRRIGRDERGTGQPRGQSRRELDQIIAVGADAVQQHDQLTGCAAGAGRHARSGKHSHWHSGALEGQKPPRRLVNRRWTDNVRRGLLIASAPRMPGAVP